MLHHHDEFWWRFFPKKELTQLYVTSALRYFAISLIGVFVPIYLYRDRGYTMEETLLFFLAYAIIFAVMTPVAAKFATQFGLKHSVLFSVPFYLIFIALLYLLPTTNIPLVVVVFFLSVSQAFYWIGMHIAFHHASHRKHRGEEIGKRLGVSVAGSALGPIVGGISITYLGFGFTFCLAGVVLLASAIVLFRSKEEYPTYHFSLKSVVSIDQWRNSLFFVSRGAETIVHGVIWPLFIFLILGSYVSLGLVGSILAGVSALLIFLTGRYSDKIGKRRIIRWAVGFHSVSWFFRALVKTVGHVFGATIFGSITSGVMLSPQGALQYDNAKGDIAAYFVNREIYLCLGRALLLLFVLMVGNLQSGFIFQGFLSFGALLL